MNASQTRREKINRGKVNRIIRSLNLQRRTLENLQDMQRVVENQEVIELTKRIISSLEAQKRLLELGL